MIASLLTKIERDIPRVSKDVWLSLTYDLTASVPSPEARNELVLRPATEEDVARIADCADSGEPIVRSSLRFWREYGFRSLYLGFLRDDPEPGIFQYVIDEQDNHRYRGMLYGRMYRNQFPETVQVENLYTFRTKRRRNLALDFERLLFRLLLHNGKTLARTHINAGNRAALLWARSVGFRPDYRITMVSIDLPLLRDMRKRFAFSPFSEAQYDTYPLSLFKQ